MSPIFIDRLLVSAAVAAFAASVLMHGFGATLGRRTGEQGSRLPPMTGSFGGSALHERTVGTDKGWAPPPSQSRGRDWNYEVFTPPEICLRPGSNELFVRSPAESAAVEPEEPFGVEVHAIQPEVYRLRLLGCVGEAGHLQGAFEDTSTGEVVLAAAPCVLDRFGAEIIGIEPSAVAFGADGDAAVSLRLATAIVKDLSNGKRVTLVEGMPGVAGTAVATLVVIGETAGRSVRAGDRFQAGDTTFAVEEISLQPGSVTMTKTGVDPARSERRVIEVAAADEILREDRP